jgi:hypothetical protein
MEDPAKLFARFASPNSEIEINASMSSQEYNLQFLHTWPGREVTQSHVLYRYISEARSKFDSSCERIKFKKDKQNKVISPKQVTSYIYTCKIKLDPAALYPCFSSRTTQPVYALCEARLSIWREVAEVSLRLSPNDILPACQFSKQIPEHPTVVDNLRFFPFSCILAK